MKKKEKPEILIGGTYKLTKKISKGAFGEVFLGINQKTKKEVAIKLESIKSKHPQLVYECKLLQYLSKDRSYAEKGIPQLFQCASQGDFNIMVMELLGPSLEELFSACSRKFSLKTVLMLADQMLQGIEYIHCRNILHRDLEPGNFLMGTEKNVNKVYLIDFGLAKLFSLQSQYGGCSRHLITGNYLVFSI